ncbi:MAG: hypothetical protein LBH19_04740 [Dysgonamonadaceae bacterium]|jgi:hypothetical protein|nr:hypothetical protein [Dysgonamonadaceae bacterium]
MKKIIVVLFLLAGLWVSCNVDSSQTIRYSVNEPVFTSSETFRNSIKITSKAHELGNIGNIRLHNGYLYISERGKGIHIIDNTNPSHPENKGYIEIPGHQEAFIRDKRLYADALVDLVWFDLSIPSQPVLQGRAENLFPETLPPIENEYGYDYDLCQTGIAQNKIVTGWQLKERKQQNYYSGNAPEYAASPPTLSQGNSLNRIDRRDISISRFGLYEHYLYAVINYQMNVIDLSGEKPQKAAGGIYIGNVENILSYRDKLFMGMSTGLVIYSLEDPARPVFCSQIAQVYGCNPVAVNTDFAYISIHSGNFCGQNINRLVIFDVSDMKYPVETASYTMNYPKGLGIDKGMLFLCDDGLKVFKTGNPQTFIADQLAYYPKWGGSDIVLFNNLLMLISDNGLYQYDCSDVDNIRWMSVIPITNN